MNIEVGKEFMEHHGVKGMKWGVRKAAKQERKAWRKEAKSAETANEVFQAAAKSFGPVVKALKKDPAFADMATNRKTQRQYDAVSTTIFNQHMAQVSLTKTMNAQGNRAVVWQLDRTNGLMHATEVKAKEVKHILGVSGYPNFKVEFDDEGFIDNVTLDEIVHSIMTAGKEFMEHHGVKGMRWGVRRTAAQLSKAEGKRESKRSEDKKTHDANRKKGSSALNDKELQALVNRMNLEQNYSRMNPSSLKKGLAATGTILAVGATANQAISFAKSPAGQAIKKAIAPNINKLKLGA